MIEDGVEDGNDAADANAPPVPAMIAGVESRIEAATTYGPVRTVLRSYLAESAEALDQYANYGYPETNATTLPNNFERLANIIREEKCGGGTASGPCKCNIPSVNKRGTGSLKHRRKNGR